MTYYNNYNNYKKHAVTGAVCLTMHTHGYSMEIYYYDELYQRIGFEVYIYTSLTKALAAQRKASKELDTLLKENKAGRLT